MALQIISLTNNYSKMPKWQINSKCIELTGWKKIMMMEYLKNYYKLHHFMQ